MPRPKGSPNIKSLTVSELCKKYKFNPVKELIELKNSEYTIVDKEGIPHVVGVSPELKAKISTDLLPYIYPKLLHTTVAGDPYQPLTIQIVKFSESEDPE
jgi:hypothetical protein